MYEWEVLSIADALASATMADLADVYRKSGNKDEYGGGPEYVKVINDTKVSVVPTDFFQYQQAQAAGRVSDITYYSVVFPKGTLVRVGDLVDAYTLGVKVTLEQVERAETFDTMVRAYGQVIEDDSWFVLNFHNGGPVT